jgi:tRNA pseudouridine38-40 synthase
VATFLTRSGIPPESFAPALNSVLPPDVSVLESRQVARGFHPRKNAEGKVYLYRVLNRAVRPAVERRRAWHVQARLDVEKMREGAKHLVGFYDFSSFAAERRGKNNYRELWRVDVDGRGGEEIEFVLEGSGFLYQMVRIIVGSLVEVGRGKKEPGWLKEALDARERTAAGPTAPPWGLYLVLVKFEEEALSASST